MLHSTRTATKKAEALVRGNGAVNVRPGKAGVGTPRTNADGGRPAPAAGGESPRRKGEKEDIAYHLSFPMAKSKHIRRLQSQKVISVLEGELLAEIERLTRLSHGVGCAWKYPDLAKLIGVSAKQVLRMVNRLKTEEAGRCLRVVGYRMRGTAKVPILVTVWSLPEVRGDKNVTGRGDKNVTGRA